MFAVASRIGTSLAATRCRSVPGRRAAHRGESIFSVGSGSGASDSTLNEATELATSGGQVMAVIRWDRGHQQVRALAALWLMTIVGAGSGVAQERRPIGDTPNAREPLALRQSLRFGSLNGNNDAFARVAFVALRNDGSIVVADDEAHHVAVYTADGRLLKRLGRQGQGPGEFETPWLVSVSRGDSVFVWDAAQARVSVFSPSLGFVRSFQVPGGWTVNSLRELPSGKLLFSAFEPLSRHALHIASRDGVVERSFAPIDIPRGVTRFHASLLGGSAIVVDSMIAFSHKSPYQIDVFDLRGRHLRSCVGSASATTPPARVIAVAPNGGTQLQWGKYVHSTALLPGPADRVVLNLIVDRENDRRVLDAVDLRTCQLLRRATLPVPIFLNDARNGAIAGFMELDYPEVLVYSLSAPTPR